MTTPTNEASRRGMKGHVTRWINNIQKFDNVQMDLTTLNQVLVAESNLRNTYSKYKRISEGVARDMEQAGATQEEFQEEVDSQIKVEEEVGDALMIVKRKREELKEIQAAEERKRHEDMLLLMFKTQQIAADATRAQKKPIKTLPGPKKKSMKTLQELKREQSANKKIKINKIYSDN
ncbi:hypothetical protein DAPPUDRAFT_329293 [Daphnia pulex]|uniref:Uncharacterized protein n=1 Tax=Daphnia pulex TaxID=6669 RepID=E9HG67_DAPPU|nr:hypothetical protein DAPPUDRAFT_329291 [Daphnia pulex]EFX69261.1 hypothetical protein DAPPUDRAFT_329293 [Daphnia pulex]|eukprot:EFX69260.1 hypothetical protein DAPPUDRAFT_329291 [Daphnia pulex]